MVRRLCDRLGIRAPHPGGASASAVAAGMSAALVAKAARRSEPSWAEADAVALQADLLGARCSELAESASRAFAAALKALEDRTDIEAHLNRTVVDLLALAEVSVEVAGLAARTAERCDGTFRGDAVCAALLAEAAACGAAVLVAGNLTVTEGDKRLREAKQHASRATEAVRRALEAGS